MSSTSDSTPRRADRSDHSAQCEQSTEGAHSEKDQAFIAEESELPNVQRETSRRARSPGREYVYTSSRSPSAAASDLDIVSGLEENHTNFASPTSKDEPEPNQDPLAFAPVALAQYHHIAQKLADNKIFRLLRKPASIRVLVYRTLLAESRLWEQLDRRERKSEDTERQRERERKGVAGRTDRRRNNMAHQQESSQAGQDLHSALRPPHLSDDDVYEDSLADSEYDAPQARPYLTRLRLALAPYTVHFRNPGYIRDETLRMLERDVVKKTLEDSRKRIELREELGMSWEFWDDHAAVLKAAIPSLEKRCFAQPDPAAPEYEGLSGPLIASYSPSLLRDLERLNQLVCIARNVLVHGERVQNLSAERLFDKDIFNLVNVCVRVTARGYDGEAGTQDEDKWQGVINACRWSQSIMLKLC